MKNPRPSWTYGEKLACESSVQLRAELFGELQASKRQESNDRFQSSLLSLDGNVAALFKLCENLKDPSQFLIRNIPLKENGTLHFNLDEKAEIWPRCFENPDFSNKFAPADMIARKLKRDVIKQLQKKMSDSKPLHFDKTTIARAVEELQRRPPGEDGIAVGEIRLLDHDSLISFLQILLIEIVAQYRMRYALR